MVVTEGWPPNVERARTLLGPGVQVLAATAESLPVPDASFDLVSSRHPVKPHLAEIRRVLVPGGHYFAQHVGPASAFELVEFFLGPFPRRATAAVPMGRPQLLSGQGSSLNHCETAHCRMEFFDVGAIVWILRKCVSWVPDFSVERYAEKLRELDQQLRRGEPFVAHSTRSSQSIVEM